MENSVSTLVLDLWLRKIYNSKDKSVKLKMDPLTSSLPSYFVSFFFIETPHFGRVFVRLICLAFCSGLRRNVPHPFIYHQLAILFWQVTEPLQGAALLKDVCRCGWAFSVSSLTLLLVHSSCFLCETEVWSLSFLF